MSGKTWAYRYGLPEGRVVWLSTVVSILLALMESGAGNWWPGVWDAARVTPEFA